MYQTESSLCSPAEFLLVGNYVILGVYSRSFVWGGSVLAILWLRLEGEGWVPYNTKIHLGRLSTTEKNHTSTYHTATFPRLISTSRKAALAKLTRQTPGNVTFTKRVKKFSTKIRRAMIMKEMAVMKSYAQLCLSVEAPGKSREKPYRLTWHFN